MDTIKHISLKESQVQGIVDHINQEQIDISNQIKELSEKFADNKLLIEQLMGKPSNGNGQNDLLPNYGEREFRLDNYDPTWSLWKKAEYVLNSSQKSLLAKEIVNGIITIEPDLGVDEQSKRKLSINVFAVLNAKYNNGALTRRKSDDGFRYQINNKRE